MPGVPEDASEEGAASEAEQSHSECHSDHQGEGKNEGAEGDIGDAGDGDPKENSKKSDEAEKDPVVE
jgi:hypothetical protein